MVVGRGQNGHLGGGREGGDGGLVVGHVAGEEVEVDVEVERRGRRRGGGESEEWIGERLGVVDDLTRWIRRG